MRRMLVGVLALLAVATGQAASANTINQNTSWTIDRAGTATKYRVVAYGDSIFAGYYSSISYVARRAGPYADGEYLAKAWNADIEVIRRTKSGAIASDIYNNKIIAERSYMQAANTRMVMFEMCGNDYLQARSNFSGQTGTCNYGVLDTAYNNCSLNMERAMQAINQYALTATSKVVVNIYYPGFDADNVNTGCNDPVTGAPINKQSKFLPLLAKSNWRACSLAAQYGFQCADSFAAYMGADYDTNGDGLVDSDALRYQAGESESSYVTRISSTLRSTLRDSNTHFVNSSTSFDYLVSDNTHPTYYGPTVYVGLFGGTGSGTSAPTFTDAQIVGGKNPVWNQYGHERMGHASSAFNPVSP